MAEPLAELPGRALLIARLLPDESARSRRRRPRSTFGAPHSASRRGPRRSPLSTRSPTRCAWPRRTTSGSSSWTRPSSTRIALPEDVASIVERAPADVGLLSGAAVDWESGDGVCVPFAGGEHDWAALELGAWLASSRGTALRLLGIRADARDGRRDASRLLADASISVQRAIGVDALPQLVDPDPAALVEAAENATIVVTGLPASWRRDGTRRGTAGARSARRARRCSCTAARARAGSLPPAAAPASPGRSRASVGLATGCLDRGDEVRPALAIAARRVGERAS